MFSFMVVKENERTEVSFCLNLIIFWFKLGPSFEFFNLNL